VEATLRAFAPAAIIFLIVALVTVIGALILEVVREWRERRTLAARLRTLDAAPELDARTAPELVRSREEMPRLMQILSARVPRLADLAVMLEQGNVKWSVQTLLLLSLGLGVGLGLALFVALGTVGTALVVAAAGAAAPFVYVRTRRARRVQAFEEHFPDAIDLMGRALRAGHPMSAAVQMVAEEMPDPVGTDFRRVSEEHRFGLAMTDVLLALADRVPLVDVRIFVTAVVIQRDVGGNLAELLDKIAYTMRERFKIRRQIRTHTAQGRITGYMLAGLPVLTALAFLFLNPNYVLVLIRTPMGHFVLAAVLALQVMGFFWIRRIIDIEI
jgi:tight adherence protein B